MDRVRADIVIRRTVTGRGMLERYQRRSSALKFCHSRQVVSYAVLLPLKSEDKLDPEGKALVERMNQFAALVRDQQAALSF